VPEGDAFCALGFALKNGCFFGSEFTMKKRVISKGSI